MKNTLYFIENIDSYGQKIKVMSANKIIVAHIKAEKVQGSDHEVYEVLDHNGAILARAKNLALAKSCIVQQKNELLHVAKELEAEREATFEMKNTPAQDKERAKPTPNKTKTLPPPKYTVHPHQYGADNTVVQYRIFYGAKQQFAGTAVLQSDKQWHVFDRYGGFQFACANIEAVQRACVHEKFACDLGQEQKKEHVHVP